MKVEVIKEEGFEEALLGLSLSYDSSPSKRVARKLAHKQGGHNKFLESIVVWLDITAPRYWWSQADTYRVGTSKQSQSTMHTLLRRRLSSSDFEGGLDEATLAKLNTYKAEGNFIKMKRDLPESFLQRRIVCTNYKVLQSMEIQRRSHKLEEWIYFLDEVLCSIRHPTFILKED